MLPMPIIVGSPRSGTTLLRLMLDAHPDMAIPPETGFLQAVAATPASEHDARDDFFRLITNFPPDAPNWQDFEIPSNILYDRLLQVTPFDPAAGVRLFYRLYADRFRKSRYGDKTPMYCRCLPEIDRLLPEAVFIHIIRDGRDASLSLRPLWFSPGTDMSTLATFWRDNVNAARIQGRRCRSYTEIRYEQLLVNPQDVLLKICRILDLAFDPVMLQFDRRSAERLAEHKERIRTDGHTIVSKARRLEQQWRTTQPVDPTRIGIWRTQMTRDECAIFDAVAGELLVDLGYAN